MDTGRIFEALAISLGLGLLVGLQRERAGSRIGGVRTFPLITMLGTVCGLLGVQSGSGWVVGAGLVSVAAATAVANFLVVREERERDPGITTEVAALLMFAVGAYAVVGERSVALAVGVAVAVLLQAKGSLHGWAAKVGDEDMRAIMLFAAITFIVLPVLPDRVYGPLGVLNPHNIWLMVVLVVGISLGGYVAYKVLGAQAGAALSGLLGGLISSTATTVTYARRSREADGFVGPALLVIMIASGVVYARLIAEISVVAPSFLPEAAWPLVIMFVLTEGLALAVWVSERRAAQALPDQQNPTELKSALFFAALYGVVLLAVAAGKAYLGNRGVYAVAAVSGLTDMDAITLSTARLVESGEMGARAGWEAILVAAISNICFKAGMVVALGSRRLAGPVAALFAVKVAVAVGLIMMWP